MHESVLDGSQRDDRRVVMKGASKSETARRFCVHRATVKRYCKQPDERSTLQPRKPPGKSLKLEEKTRKLPLVDLEEGQ
jgi:transposase